MKRRATLGMLSTEHGMVAVKHRVVAAALSSSDAEIERLCRLIEEMGGRIGEQRKRAEMCECAAAQMDRELSRLRAHWWIRLGRALYLLR